MTAGLIGFLFYLFMLFMFIRAIIRSAKKTQRRNMTPGEIDRENARVEAMRDRARNARAQRKPDPAKSAGEPAREDPARSGEGYCAPSMAYEPRGEGFGTQGETAEEHEAHLMRGAIQGESALEHEAHLMRASVQGETDAEHAEHIRAADAVEPDYRKRAREPYFRGAADLRRAVVAREILDPPLSIRGRR